MRFAHFALLLVSGVTVGCKSNEPIDCQLDSDCSQAAIAGRCLPSPVSDTHWCAFPDTACSESEQRWGILTGDGLARECVAALPPDAGVNQILSVALEGTGSGIVTSAPAGIACGTTCSASYPAATVVELTAAPGTGSAFVGWSDGCAGYGACSVTMDSDVSVGAAFATPAQVLWAAGIGSPFLSSLSKVLVHPNGNLVVVGMFGGELELGGVTYPGDDDSDTFVAMLTPATGDPLWVRPLGGALRDAITSVAIGANGDLFIAGEFEDSINIGTGMLTAVGAQDAFVARLSPVDGHAIWAQQLGGDASLVIQDLAAHPDGDLLLSGRFLGTVDLGQDDLVSTGTDFDGYVARLDGESGSSIWATSFFSAGRAEALSLVVDTAGDAYAAGFIEGQVDFGFGNVNADGKDWYIVHLRGLDGHIEWANTRADAGDQAGVELALDGTGRILLGGTYTGAPDFGTGTLPVLGGTDVFIARFFPSGLADDAEWSLGLGSSASDAFGGVAVDGQHQPIVTGAFAGAMVVGTTNLMPTGQSDAFITKLSSSGVPIWASKLGGAGLDGGESVAADAGDVIYATGSFSSTAVFGSAVLESLGEADTYVVRLAP